MRHKWTYEDNYIVSECYLQNKSIEECHKLVPHISKKSLNMKYHNCKYLHKQEGYLSHFSKLHKEVWDTLMKTYSS